MFLGDVAAGEDADLIAAVARRLGDAVAIEDVAWSSTFRMQNRLVPRMGDERRFLLGDESHLSSPFGGEGLNSGLFDACDLAWKLALTMRGRARPSLLDTFEVERSAVDAHVLEVSDRIHGLARAAISAAATGEARPPARPEQIAALARARSMADVSYAGSPLVGSYEAVDGDGPQPGARYPGRCRLGGRAHHLLVGAERLGDEPLQRFRARWSGLVEVVPGPSTRGALLVRPDGIVGFRAASADAPALSAIDAHLASYLVPE
jgi:4,5-epoxidase